MIRLLVPVLAVLVTVFGTYAAAQYAKTRRRLVLAAALDERTGPGRPHRGR